MDVHQLLHRSLQKQPIFLLGSCQPNHESTQPNGHADRFTNNWVSAQCVLTATIWQPPFKIFPKCFHSWLWLAKINVKLPFVPFTKQVADVSLPYLSDTGLAFPFCCHGDFQCFVNRAMEARCCPQKCPFHFLWVPWYLNFLITWKRKCWLWYHYTRHLWPQSTPFSNPALISSLSSLLEQLLLASLEHPCSGRD